MEHHLNVLIAKLSDTDPWKTRLRPFEKYSPFATTWRYPSPGGRLPSIPDPTEVVADAKRLEALIQEARIDLKSA